MPARRRNRNVAKKNRKVLIVYFWIVVFVVLLTCCYILLRTKYWNSKSNLVVAVDDKEGIVVLVLNPSSNELYKLIIPANTQVDAAGNLGSWKAGSLWELSKNEGKQGVFFADTIIKNFYFPIVGWADKDFNELYQGALIDKISYILFNKFTNLTVGDRIAIVKFMFAIKDFKRYEINLGNTAFLNSRTLKDGSRGYIISGNFPNNLLTVFNVYDNKEYLTASIVNIGTQKMEFENIVRPVEVMGVKVVSTIEGKYGSYDSNEDCVIEGKRDDVAPLARVFGCKAVPLERDGGIDITMLIGDSFIARY